MQESFTFFEFKFEHQTILQPIELKTLQSSATWCKQISKFIVTPSLFVYDNMVMKRFDSKQNFSIVDHR